MTMHVVTADLTLTDRVPALAPLAAVGAASFEEAALAIDQLVAQLGGGAS
jgi:hypothetical protein